MSVLKRRLIRAELANNILGQGEDLMKVGRGKHLEPGVVAYDNEDGSKTTYLLTREAIAAMRPTMKGIPLIGKAGGFDHMKVNEADAKRGKYDGEVLESYDGPEGWEHVLFQIRNKETAEKCADGYQLSCAYVPTDVEETPGVWHNVPYDAVIKNGQFTHLAVVPNPRYEGANIELLNSMSGGIVNKTLKAILAAVIPIAQLKELVNSIEEDQEKDSKKAKAKADFDQAMANAKTPEEKAAAQAIFEKANAEADAPPVAPQDAAGAPPAPVSQVPPQPLGGGDVVPEPGMPGAGAPKAKPNAAPEGMPPAAAAEAAKEGEPAAQEAAEKAALEAKNAKEASEKAEADKKDREERANALKAFKIKAEAKDAERRERFNSLRKAAQERGGTVGTPFVGVVTSQEREDLGRDRYGSRK
jgi:hypothetical protein